jgi:hypothetical protein
MTPIVLVPGMLCTSEIFASQTTALWPYGSVTVASTLEGKTIAEMAAAILAAKLRSGRHLDGRLYRT